MSEHLTATKHLTAFLGGPDSPDIRNPIHSTVGAAQYGYAGALVGGVTVYAWTIEPILEVLGEEWLDHGWVQVDFRRPVYPGADIRIDIVQQDSLDCSVNVAGPDSHPCVSGIVGLGTAPWFSELSYVALERPVTAEPVLLKMGTAPVGKDIQSIHLAAPADEMTGYAYEMARSTDPRFVGRGARVHPGWLAGCITRLMYERFVFEGPGIHVSSRIQHLGPAKVGQEYTVTGRLVRTYERKGHHYAVVDGSLFAADGAEVARIRQDSIFKVAQRSDGE